MEIFLGLAIVGIALAIAFGLSLRKRNEIDVETDDKPKRVSRRERKLQEIRSNEPDVVIPTINDLIEEELNETGVNEIDGHSGLTDPVKLKVYHRDIEGLGDCARENLRFRLSYGITAEEATENDVRLVCEGSADDGSPADRPVAAVTDAESEASSRDPEPSAELIDESYEAASNEFDSADGR